jgi:hypothetical protein
MFKNFSGSGTDNFSGSEAGRLALKSGNLSDTNTHLSIEIQIPPKNGMHSKPTDVQLQILRNYLYHCH